MPPSDWRRKIIGESLSHKKLVDTDRDLLYTLCLDEMLEMQALGRFIYLEF